jgi:renalase
MSAHAAVAVVGAGIAGIAAARTLQAAGVAVTVFDKGRSAGGRVATRRREGLQFDHGAQFFTVRTAEFAAALAPLQSQGIVQLWRGPFRTLADGVFGEDPRPGALRFVGVPGMSALPRAMSQGLVSLVQARVDGLAKTGAGWLLQVADLAAGGSAEHGPFSALVLAVPAAQAEALLAAALLDAALLDSALHDGPVLQAARAHAQSLQPCLAALVAFEREAQGAEGGLFVTDPALSFVAHDGGKPGRGGAATYVLHATAPWSDAHFAAPPDDSAALLVAAFSRCLGRPLPKVVHLQGHRWRYALAPEAAALPVAVADERLRLLLCGDGLSGGRVEGAFSSGLAAARRLLAMG